MVVGVSQAIKRGESWNDKPARWLIVKDVLPRGEESMSLGLQISAAGGM